ncbi:uncharacterized protein AMSG_09013 [Thecamonas trahens ATCC 50062]|uniref:Secreted protein n=1 Tax=Thecamonas trahens ATCC 50062 TaxID=461836 RepID=A0A0L0DLE1_THETB|nr:hypothetical protein AMSG_09013 [Thecamonas trahens ATCC 50062]KNC52861.1 hypothetical protein AMSG_09013 [Thecamonas trahens ATCC 50062]|eukprot:XP_013754962.1 hypothetical protein AMSG_09013 [Thecamonas trahens ATCC 50062]
MKLAVIIAVFSCLMAVSLAHVCMFNPAQRTALEGVNAPHADACGLMTGPCGGAKPTDPEVWLMSGQKHTIVFQKNLNHYDAKYPQGGFQISYAEDDSSDFHSLAFIKDTNTSSLTVYTAEITAPTVTHPTPIVIRTEYIVSFGSFKQCANIGLLPVGH